MDDRQRSQLHTRMMYVRSERAEVLNAMVDMYWWQRGRWKSYREIYQTLWDTERDLHATLLATCETDEP